MHKLTEGTCFKGASYIGWFAEALSVHVRGPVLAGQTLGSCSYCIATRQKTKSEEIVSNVVPARRQVSLSQHSLPGQS